MRGIVVPEVEPTARISVGLRTLVLTFAEDPTHRRAADAVNDGEFDQAIVVTEDGYVLYYAARITDKSWAWRTSSMPAMAFLPYHTPFVNA